MGEREKKRLLAVSGDSDWALYAKDSKSIAVVEKLQDALAKLQEHAKEAETLVQRLLSDIDSEKRKDLADELESLLGNELQNHSLHVEAASDCVYDYEQPSITLKGFQFVKDENAFDAKAVQTGDEMIVVSIDLTAFVEVEASFDFSVHDSTDDDYVRIGDSLETREEEFDVTVLVTFEGDLEKGDIAITNVELVTAPRTIDFGEVSPDFSDDADDDDGGGAYEDEPWPDDNEPWPDDAQADNGEQETGTS